MDSVRCLGGGHDYFSLEDFSLQIQCGEYLNSTLRGPASCEVELLVGADEDTGSGETLFIHKEWDLVRD